MVAEFEQTIDVLAPVIEGELLLLLYALEDAIRRMTSMQANLLGLHYRGLVAVGMAADLVVLDPQKIQDKATFENPLQYAEGVDYLLINGTLAIDEARITNPLPGQVLRRPGNQGK